MKKITLLTMLFFSITIFSQEQLMLDIDLLLANNGNGNLRISSSSNQTLYESYGAAIDNYGTIMNLTSSSFPLTIVWRPGINAGCNTTQTYTYTWSEYFDGKTFLGGCAPEYFYLKSPYINKATAPFGVCDTLPVAYGVNYYSTTGSAPWTVFPSPYTAQNILGSGFRGNLHVRSDIDSFHANPKVTMPSKVTTYTITGCSPELDGQPVPQNTKCKFESSGSVTLKFLSDLNNGDKFLFNIFKSGVFDKSLFVSKAEVINKTFTWTGLAEGSYYIKYQSQTTADNNTTVGNSAITTNSFSVGSPAALSFSITQLQPKCNGEQGAIQLSATGGTSPYYYMIDGETLLQKHPLTATPIPLSEGDHKVIVVDSNACIEK